MEPSLEVQLARAYDSLVESRGTGLSFREEAFMVAVFTRLYVQNLFQLNETAFKRVMRKNRELHAKASQREHKGKNPLDALKLQIRRGDDLGRMLGRYAKHLGSLDCILDTKATAALVHQMIHMQPSRHLPAELVGCEFGSGTGILSIAGTIPFVHRGKSITVHCFEQSLEPRDDMLKITRILQKESKYSKLLQFYVHSGDITGEKPYQVVQDVVDSTGPLALWISETFGFQSKKPVISADATTCTFAEPAGTTAYSRELEKKYDPFSLVLNHSCHHFPSFLQQIRSGNILAFPDIVTPSVIIDGEKSALLAADGKWRKLHTIGQPYDMLPPCVPTRWFFKARSKHRLPPKLSSASRRKRKRKK